MSTLEDWNSALDGPAIEPDDITFIVPLPVEKEYQDD